MILVRHFRDHYLLISIKVHILNLVCTGILHLIFLVIRVKALNWAHSRDYILLLEVTTIDVLVQWIIFFSLSLNLYILEWRSCAINLNRWLDLPGLSFEWKFLLLAHNALFTLKMCLTFELSIRLRLSHELFNHMLIRLSFLKRSIFGSNFTVMLASWHIL